MSKLGGKKMSEDTDRDSQITSVVAGDRITVDNTDPTAPVVTADIQAGGQVDTVVGGTNCSVDATDPVNLIVNADTQNNAKVTTKGDLEGFSTVAARIPVGSNGQVLTADSAEALGLKWATAAAGGAVATDVIWDAKGDLAGGTGSDTAARLAVGTNGQVLSADSAEATGLKWIAAAAGSGVSAGRAERQANFALSGDTTVSWDTEIYDDDNFIDIAGAATELAVGTASRVNVFASMKTTNTVSSSIVIISINHFNSSDSLIANVAKHQSDAVSGITAEAITALGIPVSSGDYFTFTIFFSDTSVTVDLATATIQDVSP